METPARVLVVAASLHGSTAEIARAIGQALIDRGLTVSVREPVDVRSLQGYDAVVLGSAVYAGHWLDPATALVDRMTTQWAERPVWLFSSGPVGDPNRSLVQKMGQDPADLPRVRAITGAREHRVFAGKIDRANLSFLQRMAVRLIRGFDGDWRDWDAITGWAGEIAASLTSEGASEGEQAVASSVVPQDEAG